MGISLPIITENRFADLAKSQGCDALSARAVTTLQINLGKLCNQACSHCHVEAGPKRLEIMDLATMMDILKVVRGQGIRTLDLTGGAPEMNPHFRYFVREANKLRCHIIDRCNLTILMEPEHKDTAHFLAQQGVEVVASLPCYLEDNVDKQRGNGVFQASIAGLKKLNEMGYGKAGSGLILNLVYNPQGAKLPPPQVSLEADYKRELKFRYGVEFNSLFTITNLPVGRFAHDLARSGELNGYLQTLEQSFNPEAYQEVMCRDLISVDWQGNLFDCDFNQMLDMPLSQGQPRHIKDFANGSLVGRSIVTGNHCLGCTAGAGSSCGGVLDNAASAQI